VRRGRPPHYTRGVGGSPDSFTVLVIDDDPTMRELVGAFLRKSGMQTVTADDGPAGLEIAQARADIDGIVLDVMMPGMDGHTVLEQLKGSDETRAIPVLLLTAHANQDGDVLRSIEGGAVDHVEKPFRGAILAAKVRSMCEQYREHSGMQARAETAETMANTDALTGLPNRRAFDLELARVAPRCQPQQRALCLIMVDVDRFKGVNDDHGHDAGDAVLRWLGDVLAAASGQAFRLGGEEFCLILEEAELAAAERAAAELVAAVRTGRCTLPDGSTLPLTVSAGVAVAGTHNGHAVDDLPKRADAALYAAKSGGRDRHVVEDAG